MYSICIPELKHPPFQMINMFNAYISVGWNTLLLEKKKKSIIYIWQSNEKISSEYVKNLNYLKIDYFYLEKCNL